MNQELHPIRVLSSIDVQKALSLKDAIKVNRSAFEKLERGKSSVPSRLILDFKKEQGATLIKPALVEDESFGLKVVSVRPNNAKIGLPTVPGFIVLVDEVTGMPLCMMDGTYLTALRTAAGSAAATEVLARQDATVLTVFGCGLQAKAHIDTILCVRNISQVFIVNRTREKAEQFVKEMSQYYPSIDFQVKSAEEALKTTDIIVTATNASKPLFDGNLVTSTGVHINGIGSYTPQMQELDEQTLKRARIFIDTEEALACGDICIPLSENTIKRESISTIGKLFTEGNELFERKPSTDITIFKSVGTAVQDISTAYAVLKSAEAKNLGTVVYL